MKETMRFDRNKDNNNNNKNDAEEDGYFDFQEKINEILEEQEEIFSLHMTAIKVNKNIDVSLILIGRCEVVDNRK
jgi:hypothetical protein